jgi:hypothetical protein
MKERSDSARLQLIGAVSTNILHSLARVVVARLAGWRRRILCLPAEGKALIF